MHWKRPESRLAAPEPEDGLLSWCGTHYYREPVSDAAVRAFLGSHGLGALLGWMEELPRRPRRAVLVPTAGNPLPATPWVGEVVAHLTRCGLQVEYLDLEGARPADVAGALARCVLVFVTGGAWQRRASAVTPRDWDLEHERRATAESADGR